MKLCNPQIVEGGVGLIILAIPFGLIFLIQVPAAIRHRDATGSMAFCLLVCVCLLMGAWLGDDRSPHFCDDTLSGRAADC